MTTVNPISVANNVPQQPIKENSTKASFKGTQVNTQISEPNMLDVGVKVGLAIAAAVGIGMAIKNGKAASEATEKLTALTKKFDDLSKVNGEVAEKLTKHERLSEVELLYKKYYPDLDVNKLVYENGKVKITEGGVSCIHEFDERNKLIKMVMKGKIEGKDISGVLDKDNLKVHYAMMGYNKLLDEAKYDDIAENLRYVNNITKEQFEAYGKNNPAVKIEGALKKAFDEILEKWPLEKF